MTSRIQPLSTEVVHLIAAGEVIDSLAAVVRELAENAIDAGATRIHISIDLSQWRVRVADNGSGMSYDDLQRAATPHSTSKIRSRQDLWRVNSLGFRGEALHSLAQFAQLDICSRSISSDEGWRISYDTQGQPIAAEVTAIAPGTVVTVTDLFGNWLPRRDSLPNVAQQLRAVQAVIQQMALCHPHLTWQVEQSDDSPGNGSHRPWFSIGSSPSAQHILPQILRDLQPTDLQFLQISFSDSTDAINSSRDAINSSRDAINRVSAEAIAPASADRESLARTPSIPSLSILMGLPDRCHRHRPDWVRAAVNGRMVKAPELEQTLLGAFRHVLPRDRHPVCFVHLHLSPDQVDWNRHPAKSEIYLHEVEIWQARIKQAIAQAMQLNAAQLPDAAHSQRLGQLLKVAEAQGAYHYSRSIQSVGSEVIEPEAIESEAIESEGDDSENYPDQDSQDQTPQDQTPQDQTQSGFPFIPHAPTPLKAIAQVHQMYILAEHPSGVWLVEQHIAHERVLYEQLRDRWSLVTLASPVILNDLSPRQIEQLQRLELTVDPFGDRLWAVRTAPEPLAQRSDCADALLELSWGGNLEAALVATACRTAIRNGTPLNLSEMQTLLDQWQRTQLPRTCPHGRPIYLQLEESSLSRFFRRHWVVGKSHGI
jgi:DNA mismatch repair protein MutL